MSDPLRFDHHQIKRVRRLLGRRTARQDDLAFVVEGATLANEAVAGGWAIEALYVPTGDDAARAVAGDLAARAAVGGDGATPAVRELAPGVLERVASTETPQPLLAVVALDASLAPSLADIGFAVVAEGVADPGNLGTILRSAEAAGCDAVVLTPGTVDAFNPKVLRASAGAVFHVATANATLDELAAAGLRLIGTSSHQGASHTETDWSGRVAIVVGNEAHGLAADAPVDDWVRIAHRGRAESLNVAMATTLLVFEAARHRG